MRARREGKLGLERGACVVGGFGKGMSLGWGSGDERFCLDFAKLGEGRQEKRLAWSKGLGKRDQIGKRWDEERLFLRWGLVLASALKRGAVSREAYRRGS